MKLRVLPGREYSCLYKYGKFRTAGACSTNELRKSTRKEYCINIDVRHNYKMYFSNICDNERKKAKTSIN